MCSEYETLITAIAIQITTRPPSPAGLDPAATAIALSGMPSAIDTTASANAERSRAGRAGGTGWGYGCGGANGPGCPSGP